VLGLKGKKKARGKIFYGGSTWNKAFICLVHRVQVTMLKKRQVPGEITSSVISFLEKRTQILFINYQTNAKANQLRKKPAAKSKKIHPQLRSIKEIKISLKNLCFFPSADPTVFKKPFFATIRFLVACFARTFSKP